MTKSTEELLRELETGGTFADAPPKPITKRQRSQRSDGPAGTGRGAVLFIAAAIVVAVVGALPLGSLALYPFSLFVTLLHETSHAVAAVSTGGVVDAIRISPDLSGLLESSGGSAPVIASAGYLGATLAGVALLLLPLRFARRTLAVLAAFPLAALLFFHPANLFTALWCATFALALAAAAWKLPVRLAAFLQIFLGLEAGLNAFRDLSTLLFVSSADSHIQTDAVNMANSLFLPPMFWAVVWTVVSVALLSAAVFRLIGRDVARLRR